MSDLVKAIRFLKPTSEFSYQNDDYSTIKWDVLEGDAPTQSEIDAALRKVKADEIAQAAKDASDKAAILSKLGIKKRPTVNRRMNSRSNLFRGQELRCNSQFIHPCMNLFQDLYLIILVCDIKFTRDKPVTFNV